MLEHFSIIKLDEKGFILNAEKESVLVVNPPSRNTVLNHCGMELINLILNSPAKIVITEYILDLIKHWSTLKLVILPRILAQQDFSSGSYNIILADLNDPLPISDDVSIIFTNLEEIPINSPHTDRKNSDITPLGIYILYRNIRILYLSHPPIAMGPKNDLYLDIDLLILPKSKMLNYLFSKLKREKDVSRLAYYIGLETKYVIVLAEFNTEITNLFRNYSNVFLFPKACDEIAFSRHLTEIFLLK